MCIVSFKERVRDVAISNARLFKRNFVDFEYLICSEAFPNGYRIMKSDQGNYLHLIGIHTNLTPSDFFDKCYNGTLTEEDFDFIKPKQSEKSVKGSVREKITVLPLMVKLFEQKLIAQNNFKKNRVECAFATSDGKCTLGFVASGRPKSLLKGNELDVNLSYEVDLIFRKPRSSSSPYLELVYGEQEKVYKYQKYIKPLISSIFLSATGE